MQQMSNTFYQIPVLVAQLSVTFPYSVAQGLYFLLGDNSNNANDEQILGGDSTKEHCREGEGKIV